MRKSAFLAVMITVLTMITPGVAQATENIRTLSVSRIQVDKKVEQIEMLTGFDLRSTKVGTKAMSDVPPSGGCPGKVQFSTTATYINHILESTQTSYSSDIICITSDPSETMRFLQTEAAMFINGDKREPDAPIDSCSHENASHPPCVEVDSAQAALCLSISERCDGLYSAAATFDLLLPDGWVWTSWPPECTLIFETELNCKVGTGTREVPPTM